TRPAADEFTRLAKRGDIDAHLARMRHTRSFEGIALNDLPGTEQEVDDIGQIMKSTQFIFKGEQASEDRVKDYSRRGRLRAFLYAGARSVAVTLWSIADEATPVLMKYFYTNLDKGMARDEALRQAKRALMREGFTDQSGRHTDASHPFYWAPFVIYGDGR